MSYSVEAGEVGEIRLNETNTVKSVIQNVAMILSTIAGTVPMYRDFGLDGSFMDLPIPAAKARMISSVREAVETWEPRATVVGVRFSAQGAAEGKLIPIVEVEINEQES